jgi:hypothetical protein
MPPGDLDSTFDGNGKKQFNFGGRDEPHGQDEGAGADHPEHGAGARAAPAPVHGR